MTNSDTVIANVAGTASTVFPGNCTKTHCVECGQRIPAKRLAAIPEAEYCVRCACRRGDRIIASDTADGDVVQMSSRAWRNLVAGKPSPLSFLCAESDGDTALPRHRSVARFYGLRNGRTA